MTQLIGLIGKAGVGKDTAALHLYREHGLYRYAFAAPLRGMVAGLLGESHWEDREWKERPVDWLGKSPRELLQTLGTEWGRELVHPHLWVLKADQVWKRVNDFYSPYTGMVISDVRFPNEADWIHSQGGILIEILRPDAAPVASHASEQQDLSGFPRHIINNTGTIDDLHDAINAIIGKVCPQ